MSEYALPSYEDFVRALAPWFEHVDFPTTLHRQLYEKLDQRVFDTGDSFALMKVARDVEAPNEEESNEAWESVAAEPNAEDETEAEADDDDDEQGAASRSGHAADAARTDEAPAAAADEEEDEDEVAALGHVLLAKRDLRAGADVWLVDHAITFSRLDELAANLTQSADLCDRVEGMLRLEPLPDATDAVVDAETRAQAGRLRQAARVRRILSKMWLAVGAYALPRPDGAAPLVCWYFHDELGSAIVPFTEGDATNAESTPVVRLEVLPLALPPNRTVFSVLWCPTDVAENSLVVKKAVYQPHWMTAGAPDKHALVDEPTCTRALTELLYGSYGTELFTDAVQACVALNAKAQEALADTAVAPVAVGPVLAPSRSGGLGTPFAGTTGPVKVYSDNSAICQALRRQRGDEATSAATVPVFEVVATPSAADCVWITHARALTRFAGGPGSVKRAFPHARCLSSFPSLDAILATPGTCAAWLRDHIDLTPELAEAMLVVYKGTAADLCLLAGDHLVRDLVLVATGAQEATPRVACASRFVAEPVVRRTRHLDSVNAWYAYALPSAAAVLTGSDDGEADGRPLVETGDLEALLKLAEPRAMVYTKHLVNALRLSDFAARQVTVKVFVVVRAVAGAAGAADASVYNECVCVLKPAVVGGQRLVEDAAQVSQSLAQLTTPYKFVGTGAPVRQALWLSAAALAERLRASFPETDVWATVQSQMLAVLRAVVPRMTDHDARTADEADALSDEELRRRRAILCATFLLAQDQSQARIQPVLVNVRSDADYASLSHVCPSAVPDLFRAALLHDETNMTPL